MTRYAAGTSRTPNTAGVKIYNLARATANQLYADFKQAVDQAAQNSSPNALQGAANTGQLALSAGYGGNFGLIFRGTIKQVRLGHARTRKTLTSLSRLQTVTKPTTSRRWPSRCLPVRPRSGTSRPSSTT